MPDGSEIVDMITEHASNLSEIGTEIAAFIDKITEKLGSRDIVSRK